MGGQGKRGATSFDGMSHEQMLQWLDQANSGTVQAAADRLVAAGREIRKIAEELKIRPQWVEWKGEGADAFRTWSGDLANATLRLGDFSDGSAKWLGRASDAIAKAQAAIPRDAASAKANLDAARSAHSDPDAATISAKSASELAALAANKEQVRQEAAAEMTKLGQAYQLSAAQMEGLGRPRFPPPPKTIQPDPRQIAETEVVPSGGTSSGPAAAAASSSGGSHRVLSAVEVVRGEDGAAPARGADQGAAPRAAEAVGMEIDGTTVSPQGAPTTSTPPVKLPETGRPDVGLPAQSTGAIPPTFGGASGPRTPASGTGQGRAPGGGRLSVLPGRSPAGSLPGRAPGSSGTALPGNPLPPVAGGRPSAPPVRGAAKAAPVRAAGGNGIVGGRPTPPTAGRAGSGLPRGPVVGGEGARAGGGGPTRRSTGGATDGTGASRNGSTAAPRPTGAGTGIVGGRPQQQRNPRTRPLTAGGSGLVGSQVSRGNMQAVNPVGRRSGAPPNGSPSPNSRRADERHGGAENRTEDEKPGQRSDPPPTPPTAG